MTTNVLSVWVLPKLRGKLSYMIMFCSHNYVVIKICMYINDLLMINSLTNGFLWIKFNLQMWNILTNNAKVSTYCIYLLPNCTQSPLAPSILLKPPHPSIPWDLLWTSVPVFMTHKACSLFAPVQVTTSPKWRIFFQAVDNSSSTMSLKYVFHFLVFQ